VVKKEREQKSLRTNVKKEQEQTDIRRSKQLLTFSFFAACKSSLTLGAKVAPYGI